MQVSTYVIDFVHHFVDSCDQSREDNIKIAKLCFSAFVWNVWREEIKEPLSLKVCLLE